MDISAHKHHGNIDNSDAHSQLHSDHDMHHEHGSLNRVAVSATIHCLTGCAIGEVLGMVIGTAIGLGTGPTIALAVTLAFISGFGLTTIPL